MAYVTSRLLRSGALLHRQLQSQPLRTCLDRSSGLNGGHIRGNFVNSSRNFHRSSQRPSQPRKGESSSVSNMIIYRIFVFVGFENFQRRSKEPKNEKESESKQGTYVYVHVMGIGTCVSMI